MCIYVYQTSFLSSPLTLEVFSSALLLIYKYITAYSGYLPKIIAHACCVFVIAITVLILDYSSHLTSKQKETTLF